MALSNADDFYRFSKALKAAGRGDLRRELNKRVKRAARPIIKDVKAAAVAGLPRSGGAGAFIAGKKFSVQTYTGKNPGIGVKINKQDPRLDTQGRLAHPVFNQRYGPGHPKSGKRVYAVQRVRPGILSDGFQSSAPAIRDEVDAAIQSVADEIVRSFGG